MNPTGSQSDTGSKVDQVSDFVYLNFLTYLQPERDPATLQELARRTVEWNRSQHEAFQQILAGLKEQFRGDPAWPDRDRMAMPDAALTGWDTVAPFIRTLDRENGGLLIALFHYGTHRPIVSDLAITGISTVAPVSPDACSEYGAIAAEGPIAYARNLEFLSVTDPRVGRRLLAGLRGGRIGVIYVDGNMGPNFAAQRADRETFVEVDFLGRRIKVKSGIARLSRSLKRPILPLMAGRPQGDSAAQVVAGDVIAAPSKSEPGSEAVAMQTLYSTLADHVIADPRAWEFGAYAHRWLVQSGNSPNADEPHQGPVALSGDLKVAVDRARVAPVHRSDGLFWVDIGNGLRGLRMPKEHTDVLERLSDGGSWSISQLQSLSAGSEHAPLDNLIRELLERRMLRVCPQERHP